MASLGTPRCRVPHGRTAQRVHGAGSGTRTTTTAALTARRLSHLPLRVAPCPSARPSSADASMMEQLENDDNIPEEFFCSISQCIMVDPVMCMDGQTYDRAFIEAWFKDKDTSPNTNEVLESKVVSTVRTVGDRRDSAEGSGGTATHTLPPLPRDGLLLLPSLSARASNMRECHPPHTAPPPHHPAILPPTTPRPYPPP